MSSTEALDGRPTIEGWGMDEDISIYERTSPELYQRGKDCQTRRKKGTGVFIRPVRTGLILLRRHESPRIGRTPGTTARCARYRPRRRMVISIPDNDSRPHCARPPR